MSEVDTDIDTVPSNGTSDVKPAKTYTEAEVLTKLRGSGKRIKDLEAQNETLEAKVTELSQQVDQERQGAAMVKQDLSIIKKANEELLSEKQAAETKRAEACKVRRDALPEDARVLVPEGLSPDVQEPMIAEIERRLANVGSPISVKGVAGRTPPEPADAVEAGAAAGKSFIFGKGDN